MYKLHHSAVEDKLHRCLPQMFGAVIRNKLMVIPPNIHVTTQAYGSMFWVYVSCNEFHFDFRMYFDVETRSARLWIDWHPVMMGFLHDSFPVMLWLKSRFFGTFETRDDVMPFAELIPEFVLEMVRRFVMFAWST